ncbi:helix-turn-helix domain-containing protein [Paraburkholderia sp. GAS82]|uniref:helix-turn-helix domain-containing protein n=1 Tax=Paraburkholderia sp. GAS82 TaxID=3035137 RepID=UPI003D242397
MPKPLRFDSAQMNRRDAEELWREALRPMYELERSNSEFNAKLETWDLGGAMLLTKHYTRDEVQFQRTRRRIATSGVDQYLIHCLLAGQLTSESEDGQHRVPLNSVSVRDMSVENIGFAKDAPMLTLSVPRAALDRLLPEGARLHGATFATGDPVGALVSSHIVTLAGVLTDMSVEQSKIAAEATLGLLAACLLPQAKMDSGKDDPRLAPMLRAHALSHIERRLLDPGLDADSLCEALKVSRTVLYGLFSEAGGVARLIRGKRLDEAMRRLVDPRRARERIGEIAYAVGFSSESTFNRAFRERFGCSPSEARGDAGAPSAPPKEDSPEALAAKYEAAVRNLRG